MTTPDVQQMQLQVDQATTLSQETGIGFTEAMTLVQRGGELGEPVTPEAVNPTYYELIGERDTKRLHNVVEVVRRDMDLTYLGALEWLQNRFDRRAEYRSEDERAAITLGQLLDGSPVTLDKVAGAAQGHARDLVMLAKDVDTPLPAGEIVRDVDGKNVVKYDAGVDLDAMLADAVNAKRAFRAAQEMNKPGDRSTDLWMTFEEFAPDWEAYTDRGIDLVASLSLWRHEAEVAVAEVEAEAKRDLEAKNVKAEKARKLDEAARMLEERAAEARAKATDDGRHGIGELMTLDPLARQRLIEGL